MPRTASRPAWRINKEIDLRFVLGYTPLEFRDTLHMLAEGEVDPRPLITGTVGLDGVETAFDALERPRDAREDPDRPAQRRDRAVAVVGTARGAATCARRSGPEMLGRSIARDEVLAASLTQQARRLREGLDAVTPGF